MWRMALIVNISKLLCFEQKLEFSILIHTFLLKPQASKDTNMSWPSMYLLICSLILNCAKQGSTGILVLTLSFKYVEQPAIFNGFNFQAYLRFVTKNEIFSLSCIGGF